MLAAHKAAGSRGNGPVYNYASILHDGQETAPKCGSYWKGCLLQKETGTKIEIF